MPMRFKLGVVQMSPDKGAVEANLDQIAEAARTSAASGAQLVLYPEAAVTGYFLEGGVAAHAMPPNDLAAKIGSRLGSLKATIELVIGFYEQDNGRPANSAIHLLVENGSCSVQTVYRKLFPPTYGVFDESRYHANGHKLGMLETRVGKVGLLVCEDMWHSLPRTLLALRGCHTILVPAATPARGFASEMPSNIERYERMMVGNSEENGVFTALSCLTGAEGNKLMAGGSMVVDPFGRKIAQSPSLGDNILVVPIDTEDVERAQRQTPLLQDMRLRWADMKRLVDEIDEP